MAEKEKPTDLIIRVLDAINLANRRQSGLFGNVLSIKSYTGLKIRHFLNNLCAPDSTIFLEIGAWHGGTAAARWVYLCWLKIPLDKAVVNLI